MNKILNFIASHSLKFWLRRTDIDRGIRNETTKAMYVSRQHRGAFALTIVEVEKQYYMFVCVCSLSIQRLTKLILAFRNFANTPENGISYFKAGVEIKGN